MPTKVFERSLHVFELERLRVKSIDRASRRSLLSVRFVRTKRFASGETGRV